MASQYLILAIVLALTLNAANRWIRAGGTLLAALALFMLALSILLANVDGSYARAPSPDGVRLAVLNLQGVFGLIATLFLLWAAWAQLGRREVAPATVYNSTSRFGIASRYAHWITAVLMLLAIPMGLFIAVLPASADRTSFLGAHQTLGLVVLLVVVVRLAWLLMNPPPRHDDLSILQRRAAVGAHIGLYLLILAFPISGFLMSAPGNEDVQFFGMFLPHVAWRGAPFWRTLHDLVLPLAFYALIASHVGAVLKHHFADRRLGDVRRMLR